MWRNWKPAIASVCLLLTLSGCKTSSDGKGITVAIDGRCEAEFSHLVTIDKVRAMSKRDVINLIVRLDNSQKAKSACGKRIISTLRAYAREL